MLEELVTTLLYEGYALYPYTPGATKNATPTPFGIVYPPAYAAENAAAFDHARLRCLAEVAEPDATLSATLRYLTPSGQRHEAREERVEIAATAIGERASVPFADGRFTLRSERRADGRVEVSSCVHNTSDAAPGADRAAALRDSLISTHILVRIAGGRFISPLETPECENVNTFPVLASEDDDAVLGAAIVLPDHPQLAAKSRGSLFDNTEIEEALLLHVHTLTDSERDQIAGQDGAVREMIERALAATPQDIIDLHSGLTEVPDGQR